MKLSLYQIVLVCLVCIFTGCASVAGGRNASGAGSLLNTSDDESLQEASSALTAVTGAMSNKDLSEQELYEAAKKMRNDPEAQTAVEAVSSAFDKSKVQVKYSPATGKRYSADMETDPETGVKLLLVE